MPVHSSNRATKSTRLRFELSEALDSRLFSDMKMNVKMAAIAALATGLAFNGARAEEITRAQVNAEMVQYEQAGFNPARANPQTWVEDAQRASQRVAAKRTTTSNGDQPQPNEELYKHH
jgi:hypothetical protein